MIRGFHLADAFTLGNAAAGVGAIFAAMTYLTTKNISHFYLGAALLPLSLLFDTLDGRVARMRHTHGAMGRELDSLADVISFGVAPAALAFAAGLEGGWDRLLLTVFVACGVSRLARYNVTAVELSAGGDKVKYFEGAPITSSLLLAALLVIAAAFGRIGDAQLWGTVALGPWQWHPLSLLFVINGGFMISKNLRIPKF